MNSHQLGTAEESTYGTFEAPDRFVEILPGESLDRVNTTINANALRAGNRVRPGIRRILTRHEGSGSFGLEVASTGFGRFFEHMLGSVDSTQPDVGGSPLVWEHVFSPGALPTGLTIQKGVEKADGTVQAFSFLGSKITDWAMAVGLDEILTLELGIDSQSVDTSEALASASYTDTNLFHFAQGDILVDTASVGCVTGFTLAGKNGLKLDRFCLGNAGSKDEPYSDDFVEITGTINAEFQNLTDFYNLFAGDTAARLDLDFTGIVIENAFEEALEIVLYDVRFEGEVPKITGPEPAVMDLPFTAFVNAAGKSIEMLYRTTDITP